MQSPDGLGIPASLAALLAMRLDRLGPRERNVLRCASIAGVDFDLDVLKALLPRDAAPFVERHIDALEQKRFIQRGEDAGLFRFVHGLMQLSAYQSMTREDRERLGKAYADIMQRDASPPPWS